MVGWRLYSFEKSLKKTVADILEMHSSSLAFGPSATRLQLFPNDCASSTIVRERSAESPVRAEG